ncbi:YlzJ-like family protein [Anoxybacteroides tepidamans]|uniref:YlzJ-like family protein n=1 Tax=Anoxybacteroides tepidamans TaxID=265948 RepID=UPI000485F21D|nr:YlzJ-like family protein [Anoxybacillus tepidamans]
MILYTIMPEHLIFPAASDEYAKQKIVYYDGIPFLARETETKEWEIVRNLSTNPADFLNQKYAPGARISMPQATS